MSCFFEVKGEERMRIGILGAADIAKRRFLPALDLINDLYFHGVAVSSMDRVAAGKEIVEKYGGQVYVGYEQLLEDNEVDAVYVPLPPSLHYKWAKKALLAGKHVFLEKPSTTSLEETLELIRIADERNLVIVENYGFVHHSQIKMIQDIMESKRLGGVRNIRTAFGFPRRSDSDIRHSKELGGGALFDAGGYTIHAGLVFLGETAEVESILLNYLEDFDVDMYGCLTMKNNDGQTLQAMFGMDCFYKCELEIWLEKGYIRAPRFYTAPSDLEPEIIVSSREGDEVIKAGKTDQFAQRIHYFVECCNEEEKRKQSYNNIVGQMRQLDKAIKCGRNGE